MKIPAGYSKADWEKILNFMWEFAYVEPKQEDNRFGHIGRASPRAPKGETYDVKYISKRKPL